MLKDFLRLLFIPLALMFALNSQAWASGERAALPIKDEKPSEACPSQDFHKFLEAFSKSEAIQRAFTKTPLIVRYLENRSEPDMIHVLLIQNYDQIKFPVFFTPFQQKTGYPITILGVSDRHAEVKISGTDSGYLVYYSFSRDTCWRLVYVEDTST
jgi:hypothetical protein